MAALNNTQAWNSEKVADAFGSIGYSIGASTVREWRRRNGVKAAR